MHLQHSSQEDLNYDILSEAFCQIAVFRVDIIVPLITVIRLNQTGSLIIGRYYSQTDKNNRKPIDLLSPLSFAYMKKVKKLHDNKKSSLLLQVFDRGSRFKTK